MVADSPLLVVAGPTASGKTSLALYLAEHLAGEIVSCDSVCVYRGLEIGAAKPTAEERARVPHHLLDVASLDEPFTAGDYAGLAREAVRGIALRSRLPIVTGGTGLYLRALLEGLSPAPPRNPELRARLRERAGEARHGRTGAGRLHRILQRLDPRAAAAIHPNDLPKLIRALEVTLTGLPVHGRSGFLPMTEQWRAGGRDPLRGFRILQLGLNPPRAELYDRINHRAGEMFSRGLVEETSLLVEQYGADCRPLTSLGYAQAVRVLRGEITRDEALAEARQGHRNYAKRQLTWFRKDPAMHWLAGAGSDPAIQQTALERAQGWIAGRDCGL
ncbi:MAG: tRNA (adenosine(37)-N6)-dimethylallyltransferase MiaA [Acidobacteriota bacterium]|nr:tRNA (adenosine(37)-N6)-dimethylallyltransferase MiaA [Acidobacteriota bacterium]